MLDALADLMTFGSLASCDKCKGQFVYKSGLGYKCTGNLTVWSRCEEVTQNPKRLKFAVPTDLREKYPFLEEYESKVKRRLINVTAPTTSSAVWEEDQVVVGKPKPLKNMEFVILGKTDKDAEALTTEIVALGGKVVQKIHAHLAACISSPTEVEKMNGRMKEAEELDVQVVSEDFVQEAKELDKPAVALIKEKSICAWGGDPNLRIPLIAENSESRVTGKIKLLMKDGGVVDPDSNLKDKTHVYQSGRDKYTATLGKADIQSEKNSYYKLQVLEADTRDAYWLFRSWGRIGKSVEGTLPEKLSLEECIERFKRLYHQKSGNAWESRDDFVKFPKKMYPIDVDYGEEGDAAKRLLESRMKSELKQPVQDLIELIFDVDTMQQVMLEFEIDLAKMPLGKLSRKQIDEAYSVLSELQVVIENGDADRARLVDGSNRFYTLVPHDVGLSNLAILKTEAQVKAKSEMLESLLDLEIAYNLRNAETDGSRNPLDDHYEQLNAEIDVLDNETEEFQLIQRYMENTRSRYRLEIDQVFVVKRRGEDERYEPFRKLGNRKLLWHGSRTTNYAGLLSQGLRIAPPEAPPSGYRFGKGIYFADMVAKSANYCRAKRQSPTGLLLLCEVALGNMYERHKSDDIKELPKGKHSTIGLGRTCPDPNESIVTKDDVQVPLGKGVPAKLSKRSSLSYNEYVVYNAAQVRVRYLVKTNFKFN